MRESDHSDRIFVDIPIGLPHDRDERPCDKKARRKLGRPRSSSVFRSPVRKALKADCYEEAKRISREETGKAVARQTFEIMNKIKEVDELLRGCDKARRVVREVHLRGLFLGAQRRAVHAPQEGEPEGLTERLAVLQHVRPSVCDEFEKIKKCFRRNKVKKDDILDAMVATVTASANELQTLPVSPDRDRCDLPMEIVYARRCNIPT